MKIIYVILIFFLFPTVLFSQNDTIRIKQSKIKYITIKGQVIDINGKPLAGIRIIGEGRNCNKNINKYSNKNGKYKIRVKENSKIIFHYCSGYDDTIFLANELKTKKQIIYDYNSCKCELTCIGGVDFSNPFFISYEYTSKQFPFGINLGINNYKNKYLFNKTSLQYNHLTDFKNNNEIKVTFSGVKWNLPFDFTLINENYYKIQNIYFNNTQNNIKSFRTKLELKNQYFYKIQPSIGLIYNKYNVLYYENFGVIGALNFNTKKNMYFDISSIFFKNFIENEFKFTKRIPRGFNLELIYKRNRFYNGYSLRIIYNFYKDKYYRS